MLFNYFNIAFRNLVKNKLHSLINVLGLSLGIASVFLITLYIQNEWSYDKFHRQSENLYRIAWVDENPQARTPHPMALALVQDFPEVENAVSLSPLWAEGLTRATHSFRNPQKDERYDEKSLLAVDTTFFKVFDFPLLKGDPETALKSVNGLLISESMAKKYFGDENPMGKMLSVDSDWYMVEVVGVFKDVPAASHFHFDFLVSYIREKSFDPDDSYYTWADFGHYNYIRLKPGTDPKALEGKLMDWIKKYNDWSPKTYAYFAAHNLGFKLQPVTDIHLHSNLRWELEPNGNIDYIYILAAAALLTLIIACVNFMNLTTARSAERAREIGVRKTLGAYRSQLSVQFLAESVTLSLVAIGVAILLIEFSLPFFNYATGLSFHLDYGKHLAILAGIGAGIGLLSGIYPALYLSGIKPHLILKGKLVQSPRGSDLRKALVVFQFSISMVLISASVIIFNQLDFLKNKNLGFDKEEVIIVPLKNENNQGDFQTLQTELLKIKGVSSVSGTTNIPGQQFNQHSIASPSQPDDDIGSSEAFVEYDFFQTLGIKLKDGRTFLRDNPSDLAGALVINETAANQLYPDGSAVGKELVWKIEEDDKSIRGTIVGVLQDFHFQSLHEPIRPLVFALAKKNFNYAVIKLSTENFQDRLAAIEKSYRHFEPIFAFEFTFFEDQLNKQYASEERTGRILAIFSVIAIFIACIGLFGMSMLNFQQRIKELSVRKVLGATSLNLLALLLGNFTKLIIISIVLATPLAWWVMGAWLKNFSYQVEIQPVIFIGAGLVLLFISWITLSYFTIKASQLNPAETLKNE
jgi:putative ABC transport system permease protein